MNDERRPLIENDRIATSFWDREVVAQTHQSWMAHPLVRAYINASVSGSPEVWPTQWLASFLGRTFHRGLSVGCGAGALERDLLGRGLCETMDAFDGSRESLRIAVDEAAKAGLSERVRYFLGDFNEPQLPAHAYDIVFVHQAMHHVAKLEKLDRAILRALKPGGLLVLDEFIGPSRHDWTDANFAEHRALYDSLPAHVRREPILPMPIQVEDPSEAIRSSEIVRELLVGFDVVERRDYGGNVLATLYPFIEPEEALVASLIETERRWLQRGAESYHAVIVARPKRGIGKAIGGARYFVEPKVKRVFREVGRGIRGGGRKKGGPSPCPLPAWRGEGF